MKVSDFYYELPGERIAKFPPKERGTTRLLVLHRQDGALEDSKYAELDKFLNPGDVLILNDTRVMRSRLYTELFDGRPRELVVLEKHGDEPQRVMYRGKIHEGDVLAVVHTGKTHPVLLSNKAVKAPAKKVVKTGLRTPHRIIITKVLDGGIAEVESETPLAELAERYGSVPLPPYLHREPDANDTERYQTVWAAHMGSAAAPTASLNMTEDLLNKLKQKGIVIQNLTLHVGLGTFLPIRTDEVEDHQMHSEWYHIPSETLDAIKTAKEQGHRVVALGTTVARTLEYYAQTKKSEGEDDIFIYPGFEFKMVDALITNFHAPKSTVLMLAAAFAGWDNLHHAYDYAVEQKYNFLSYGDSMLIC